MENQFFVDSEYLTPEALERKHRLETDPSSRKSHMEYLPGMEQIESDVCRRVMEQMESYDCEKYTAKNVKAALEHVVWSRWPGGRDWRPAAISETPFTCSRPSTLPITVKITACTAGSTVTITSTV